MPRKWTNGGSGGGCSKHRFVERTPVKTVDYSVADAILSANARADVAEQREEKRRRYQK